MKEERRLTIPSRGERLAEARSFVADIATRCGLAESAIFDIQVAVGEAVANAIEHGSPRGRDNEVCINCYKNEESLIITVIDQGVFKRTVPPREVAFNYRGHGILLMLALMDIVTIDELPQGTKVTLIKKY